MQKKSHPQPLAEAPGMGATQVHRPRPEHVHKAIGRRSFATLATTSPAGRPHVAGVLFECVDRVLYVNTLATSRKARNVAANPHIALCILIRRLPVGPPSTVQFQGRAEVLELDDPEIVTLIAAGRLKTLIGHGELDESEGCFLRITFGSRLVTYGLGMSISRLIGDPLHAGGVVELDGIESSTESPGVSLGASQGERNGQ